VQVRGTVRVTRVLAMADRLMWQNRMDGKVSCVKGCSVLLTFISVISLHVCITSYSRVFCPISLVVAAFQYGMFFSSFNRILCLFVIPSTFIKFDTI
jgi:hypothetical protein